MKAACFITSHGMGHATRACAVMQALQTLAPRLEFEIYTKVPAWVFEDSLRMPFRLHPILTDIGLVQRTPLEEDIPQTLKQLGMLMPYQAELIRRTAGEVHRTGCQFILCDIAPLGILIAQEIGIPSILVENFRWDWIYANYTAEAPELQFYIDYMCKIFDSADIYIQTEPVCKHNPKADFVAPPISRGVRTFASKVRRQLDIPVDKKVVLISASNSLNIQTIYQNAQQHQDLFLLFSGDGEEQVRYANAIHLTRYFYHPDLVNASDAVAAKVGYSTLAEAFHGGTFYAYIPRRRFRESGILSSFIEQHMDGFEIDPDLENPTWLAELSKRLSKDPQKSLQQNGALLAAQFILEQIRLKGTN